jgi:tetratricopeptide (TPR) repeat protein
MSERKSEIQQTLLDAACERDGQAVRDSLADLLMHKDLTDVDLSNAIQPLAQLGMCTEVLDWLERFDEDVEGWRIDLSLALLRIASGDVQKSLATLEGLTQSELLSGKTYATVANFLMEHGHGSEAVDYFDLSFADRRISLDEKMTLAAYHWVVDHKKRARDHFAEAYEKVQEDWAGFLDLPALRQKTFRGESLTNVLEGVEDDPAGVRARLDTLSNADADANILFNRAVLSAQLGDSESAVNCIESAYRMLPKDTGIGPARAIIYYHEGALQRAVRSLQMSLLNVRSNPSNWVRLGFIHWQLGEVKKALSALYESFQLHKNPIVLLCIAHLSQDYSAEIYDDIAAAAAGEERVEWELDIDPYRLPAETLASEVIDKVFESSVGIKASVDAIKKDLVECKFRTILPESPEALDATHKTLTETAQQMKKYSQQVEHFLELAKAFASLGRDGLLAHALARYSYAKAVVEQHDLEVNREYLQAFFFLFNQLSSESRTSLEELFFESVVSYFRTFNIHIRMEKRISRPADRFYSGYVSSAAREWSDAISLGICILEIATANIYPIRYLINRMKQPPRSLANRSQVALRTLTRSLQQKPVFSRAPSICLTLLARINYEEAGSMLAQPRLYSGGRSRKRVARAVLNCAKIDPSAMFSSLAEFSQVSDWKTKNGLAFSLAVEPRILDVSTKAQLIVAALGVRDNTPLHRHLVNDFKNFAGLFDRFIYSTEISTRVGLAGSMQATIRKTRGWAKDSLRGHPIQPVLVNLLDGIQGYVIDLSAGLVVQADLSLRVVTDSVPYRKRNCRITLEISNPSGGSADSIELEVLPVRGKYQVDEWRSSYDIEEIGEHTSHQQEVFINPVGGVRDEIQLEARLRYKTADKVKAVEIDEDKRTVRFFPETEFKAIPTNPYDIQSPAREWFRGRRELLAKMTGNLRGVGANDMPMVIYGLRRAGKTSLVQRFLRDEIASLGLEEIYLPIWVNIASGDAEAYSPTVEKFRGLGTLKELGTDGDFLKRLIEIMVKAAKGRVAEVQSLLPSISEMDFNIDPYDTFSTFLDQLLELVGRYKLLLALDEWAGLLNIMSSDANEGITPYLFAFLSNLIQNNENLTFIFSGTPEILRFMELHPDLEKICVSYKVGYLDEASARRLVRDPVEGWFKYGDGCVDHIIYLAHCHPYLIQLLCMLLVSRMNFVVKRPTINLSDIEALEKQVVEGGQMRAAFWSEFDSDVPGEVSDEQKVLFLIAERGDDGVWVSVDEIIKSFQRYDHPMSREGLLSACSPLIDAEMLEVNGEEYRVTIPLFRKWLRTNSLRDVGLQ